jgi:hypothetical protein
MAKRPPEHYTVGMVRRSLAVVLPLLALAAACRITPEEIERIEVENELLREQIQEVRENCEYYRDLDVRPDDTAAGPAPGPVPED